MGKMFFRIIVLSLAVAVAWTPMAGQLRDTITCRNPVRDEYKRIALAGVPILATGLIIKSTKPGYPAILDLQRGGNSKVFDVVRYAPVAAMIGMKAMGVESRSSWGRMLTADAASTMLMMGVVHGLKNKVDEQRPDGSDYKSFPSGHAAVAFMTATMLAREYGWKSPWYTIGAYAVATATGVSRVTMEKHWAGDVVSGAGIGILATEVGYMVSDLLFKKKGLSAGYLNAMDEIDDGGKWYIGLRSGVNIPLNNIEVGDYLYGQSAGVDASVEGRYMILPHVGMQLTGDLRSASLSRDFNDGLGWQYETVLKSISATCGPAVTYPAGRVMLTGSAGIGYSHYMVEHSSGMKPRKGSLAVRMDVDARWRIDGQCVMGLYAGYVRDYSGMMLPDNRAEKVTGGTMRAAMHSLVAGFMIGTRF